MGSIVVVACFADSGAAGLALVNGLRQKPSHVALLEQIADPHQRAAALYAADVALIVLGPHWSQLAQGAPGIDAMRAEVDYLLRDSRARLLLPVLVQGATMPAAATLPPGLQPLAYVQAITLPAAPTEADFHQMHMRIATYRKDEIHAAQAKGNYLWFKIAGVIPLAMIFGDLGVRYLNTIWRLVPLGAVTDALSMTTLLVYIGAVLALWITSIVIAARVRRHIWLIANILSIPAPLLPALVYVVAPHNAILTAWCVFLAILLVVNAMMLHPIWFGLVLPPFRQKRDAI